MVDGADLGILLGAWGTASGDINGDGVTELARGFSNSIEVLRLANPPLLLTIPSILALILHPQDSNR